MNECKLTLSKKHAWFSYYPNPYNNGLYYPKCAACGVVDDIGPGGDNGRHEDWIPGKGSKEYVERIEKEGD